MREAWARGWVQALEHNAVHPRNIPKALFRLVRTKEAFRSGWVAKMRFKPLSLWELPEPLREDPLLVGALVEGWSRRIESLSEGDLWVLPPRVWLSPVAEFPNAPAMDNHWEGAERAVDLLQTQDEVALSQLWTDADAQIQSRLREKCAALFWRDPAKLKSVLLRHFNGAR